MVSSDQGASEPSRRAAPRPIPPAGAAPTPPRGPPTTSSRSSAVRLFDTGEGGRRRPSAALEDGPPASESLRSLARCVAAARNPRSNINRVNALDFTLWQVQWSFVRAALCATRTLSRMSQALSLARRSIVSKDLRRSVTRVIPPSQWLISSFITYIIRIRIYAATRLPASGL